MIDFALRTIGLVGFVLLVAFAIGAAYSPV